MGEGRREKDVVAARPAAAPERPSPISPLPPMDRTYKLFIGGKQVRPDQGYSRKITAADGRAQILYYIAENLATRAEEFAARVGRQEVDASVARLFTYAAWADKWDGA